MQEYDLKKILGHDCNIRDIEGLIVETPKGALNEDPRGFSRLDKLISDNTNTIITQNLPETQSTRDINVKFSISSGKKTAIIRPSSIIKLEIIESMYDLFWYGSISFVDLGSKISNAMNFLGNEKAFLTLQVGNIKIPFLATFHSIDNVMSYGSHTILRINFTHPAFYIANQYHDLFCLQGYLLSQHVFDIMIGSLKIINKPVVVPTININDQTNVGMRCTQYLSYLRDQAISKGGQSGYVLFVDLLKWYFVPRDYFNNPVRSLLAFPFYDNTDQEKFNKKSTQTNDNLLNKSSNVIAWADELNKIPLILASRYYPSNNTLSKFGLSQKVGSCFDYKLGLNVNKITQMQGIEALLVKSFLNPRKSLEGLIKGSYKKFGVIDSVEYTGYKNAVAEKGYLAAKANAAMENMMRASIFIRGFPLIRPGSAIKLNLSKNPNKSNAGVWVVTKVRHVISPTDGYHNELSLARNSAP